MILQDGKLKNQIAIVGMACKFPGADNIEQYWNVLKHGKETIHFFSGESLLNTTLPERLITHPNYMPYKGTLNNIDAFDNNFFTLLETDRDLLTVQSKNLLMTILQALIDAEIPPDACPRRTSVYTGSNDTVMNSYSNYSFFDAVSLMGAKKRYHAKSLASLVSYQFGLEGSSMNLYTACSTSLVAVNQACQDLLLNHSDVSIVGTVSIDVPQESGYLYEENGIFSVDGHCKAFDAGATGTVFSNGVGVVILKRLEDAIRDENKIYAVIIGKAINNDGNLKTGMFSPGINGQYYCIKNACKNAGIDPGMIDYIEAHGSATLLGDSIEIFALKKVLKESTIKIKPCGVGSVKTNLGHTTVASGMAALIKTSLMLKNNALVPSLHFQELNPNISIENTGLYISTDYRLFDVAGHSIIAGVSNFGLGGTNVHIILRSYSH